MGNFGKSVNPDLDFSKGWVEFTPDEIEEWNQRGILPHDREGRLQFEVSLDSKTINAGQALDIGIIGDIPWSRIIVDEVGEQNFRGIVYLASSDDPLPCTGMLDSRHGRGWLLAKPSAVEMLPSQYC